MREFLEAVVVTLLFAAVVLLAILLGVTLAGLYQLHVDLSALLGHPDFREFVL